jgi:hypothetical protein
VSVVEVSHRANDLGLNSLVGLKETLVHLGIGDTWIGLLEEVDIGYPVLDVD